jgi:hypothetical protein
MTIKPTMMLLAMLAGWINRQQQESHQDTHTSIYLYYFQRANFNKIIFSSIANT